MGGQKRGEKREPEAGWGGGEAGRDAERARRAPAGKRRGGGDKSLDIRRIPDGDRRDAGQRNHRRAAEGEANLFLEGQEADGLLKAAEGDVEGVEVFGLAEEAVEAGLQEVELVQEGGLVGLMLMVVAGGQGLAEMLEVAGEGRGGQAELGAQGAEGEADDQGLVDVPGRRDCRRYSAGPWVFGFRFSVFGFR